MDLPSLPGPDDVAEAYLQAFFGKTALIVAVFVVANFLASWFGLASSSYRWGIRGMRIARATHNVAVRASPAHRIVALIYVVAVVIVGALWLWLCSVMGHGASYMASGTVPLSGPELRPFLAFRSDDYYFQFHIWAAIAVLLHSVARALRRSYGEPQSPLVFLLIVPWGLFGIIMGIYSVIFGIAGTVNWHNDKGFGYDLYGTWVNPAVYMVLAFTAWAFVKVSLLV